MLLSKPGIIIIAITVLVIGVVASYNNGALGDSGISDTNVESEIWKYIGRLLTPTLISILLGVFMFQLKQLMILKEEMQKSTVREAECKGNIERQLAVLETNRVIMASDISELKDSVKWLVEDKRRG